MSAAPSSQPEPASPSAPVPAPLPDILDVSARVPLLALFLSAAGWLLIGSVFALIASIKFHAPGFLAGSGWLTYGRIYPVSTNLFLYGFCVQAGLGVALWLLGRLGQTTLAQLWLVGVGGFLWNLGVIAGVLGVLDRASTGFEHLEMPGYAAMIMFLGYVLLALCGVLTFHQRKLRELYASQWFLFTALFWFPWIYSTANLLLVTFPVRGVVQSILDWWYSQNLQVVWLGLVGLAIVFYFIPKLSDRELHSRYLAVLVFWMLVLLGPWGGIPNSAPVPAWLPVASTISAVLLVTALIAVALNVYRTIGCVALAAPGNPSLSFTLFAVAAFIIAGLMRAFGGLLDSTQELQFTWFATARSQLHAYGFFAMAVFGAVYWILPRIIGLEFPWPKLVRAHFWVAAVGITLLVLPLAIGGIVQALQLQKPNIPFTTIANTGLTFLRVSTIGDLLLLCGHLIFLGNLISLALKFYSVPARAAYMAATADLFKTVEAKS